MRTLTSTLSAAQKSASGRPYVRAVLADYWGDRARLRFTRLYDGSEAIGPTAVVGALVRARIDPASNTVYTSRVASPGSSSSYSSWAALEPGVAAGAGLALASRPDSSQIFIFYGVSSTVLRLRSSGDGGASWSAPVDIATVALATRIAAAFAPSGGRWTVFWNEGATVYWQSDDTGRTAWTNSVASVTGLAVKHSLDWQVIVTGTELTSTDPKVWSCIFGDGVDQATDTWSGLLAVTTAAAAANVSFSWPCVELSDAWRLFYVEAYTGTVAYTREQRATMGGTQNFKQDVWSEAEAFNYGLDYGLSCAFANLGGFFWLVAADGVWRARSPTSDDVDLSDYVLEATVEVAEDGGVARVVFQDVAAVTANVARGMRLRLSPGYYAEGVGPEAAPVDHMGFWIESIERLTSPSSEGTSPRGPRVVLHCRDAWWLLERWRARRQLVWAAGTKFVSQILMFLGGRAGLDVAALSNSAAFVALTPAFTVHPGESGKAAVRRLLAMVPDEAIMRSGLLATLHPQAADASAYSYGTDHAIVSGAYRDLGLGVNRAQVFGAGVFDEEFDFADIDAFSESIGQAKDLNVTTGGQAGDRADFSLREATVRSRRDELQLFGVNCGQELYDVVDLTDAQVGLAAAKRRVLGLTWRYSTEVGRRGSGDGGYAMTVRLGLA